MDAVSPSRREPGRWALDCLLILLLTAALILPLFRVKYRDAWGSIENIFIADARVLRDNGFHMQWYPYWYCGTRFDYIYPPALRYGTATISMYPKMTTARAYHIYTGTLYCLGIMGVYLLIRTGMGSRKWAWLGAAAAATISPCFLIWPEVFTDAAWAHWPPQRLGVLVRYGEGPHISAFSLVGIALAFAWRGLRRTDGWLALAAILCALVVSNNFYGATALAIFFPIAVWSLWLTHRDNMIWLRAAAIAVLAYGLCAFWLTPSYVQLTLQNMRLVSQAGNDWSRWVALAAAAGFCAVSWFFADRIKERAWPVFVCGSVLFVGLVTAGGRWFGFRLIGEPIRLLPEFDLCVIMLGLLLLAWLSGLKRVPQAVVVMLILTAFVPARYYVRHPWSDEYYLRYWEPEKRIEYRATEWLHKNLPGARTLAVGTLRFSFNTWFDERQMFGASEQGLLNQNLPAAMWQATAAERVEPSVLWLLATGTDAVFVSGAQSEELYHDFRFPKKYDGVLPVLWDDGRDNKIYGVPRRYASPARVVDAAKLAAVRRPDAPDEDTLMDYVDALENGPASPVEFTRESPDRIRLKARVEPGQRLVLLETYDPAWHAYSAGKPVPIRRDPLQFMRIDAPAGEREVILVFETPLENRVGRWLLLPAALALLGLCWSGYRRA